GARYGARVADRAPGHPGADYVPELIALANRAQPAGCGPLYSVDTTTPLDIEAVTRWLGTIWP
ncbi:MAG: hypothetical protein U1D06_00500, partial [Paracoccaceae bacterium]|nr:hypothetical protein [Paracoccaceae bacterium]